MPIFELLAQHQDPLDLNPVSVIIFVVFGGFMGYIFRSIPGIRWVAAASWLYVAINSPILTAWWTGFFWMAWSFAIVFALRWKNRFLEAASFDLSLPSPSGSVWAYRFRVLFRGLWRVIKWITITLWRFTCEATYFILITLPVNLMRLSFWLCRTIPKLRTLSGWWYLLKGILLWLWYLIPWQVRSEWDRLWKNKSVEESFQEEMRKVYQKEKEKQRKRQERELRSSFRRFKKFVKGAARAGVDPEEYARAQQEEQRQQQSASQSSQSSQTSDNFRERHRQQTQSEKQQRESARSSQSQQQQSSSQSQQQSTSSSQSSRSSYQAPPKDKPKPKPAPKPQPKKITPLDKEFYDDNKEVFVSAGWIYSPSEERFKKYDQTKLKSEAFKILDIPADSDTKVIKKAKRDLSKQYLKFTYPIHPPVVNDRANQVMAVVNHASDMLLK